MNKAVKKLILSIWIGITLSIYLFLSKILFGFVRWTLNSIDGGLSGNYRWPIHEVVLPQIVVSLIALFFGLIWCANVWIVSDRILLLLRFSRPQNSRFNSLRLLLVGFGIVAICLGIALGNIDFIYDQIQGRERNEGII